MRYFAVLAVLFALVAASSPALADHHRDRQGGDPGGDRGGDHNWQGGNRSEEGRRREDMPPLDRFLPDIRRQHPGRFLDAQPHEGPNGEHRTRIKWQTPDGRVIWMDMDARTGRILGPDSDRDEDDRGRRR